MNRIEEALRRARLDPKLPGAFAVPRPDALEQFVTQPHQGRASAPIPPDWADIREPITGPVRPVMPPPVRDTSSHPASEPEPDQAFAPRMVISPEIKPSTVEQYRRLAAALHRAQSDTKIKVVMIASALPGEGKTLTAINLALTLSESYGRRVLLVDADFRRPMLHEALQAPNVVGLIDGLKSDAEDGLTVIDISPRLSLLPAGHPDPDPMSALTSDRMRCVLEEAATKFDWVLLDTPPMGILSDAHLLAAMAHVAVLVIQAGRTPFALIQRAVASLDRTRLIGVVLNRVEHQAAAANGNYGDHYGSH